MDHSGHQIQKRELQLMKRRLFSFFILFVFTFPFISCAPSQQEPNKDKVILNLNQLSIKEKNEGWILVFDGSTFNGWRGVGRSDIPEGHWILEEGCIKKIPSGEVPLQEDGQPLQGGDIMTQETFKDFELQFEWKISRAGNSGIKYNVSEEMSMSHPPKTAALGFEYQILDDKNHPDAANDENRTAAALYDLIAPKGKILNPVGQFNTGRIVFTGNHGEHWLNGKKVLEYDLDTPRMDELIQKSKYAPIKGFADKRSGHIVLQDHTDEVWYRNIKIRKIK
ncbi:MAG: DUF1080 domain-containing protein [Candidatus Aminicenantes bacterium]|nr:DUF1080 domain-containing protein [Candidatus Aminicenantes bacterium]